MFMLMAGLTILRTEGKWCSGLLVPLSSHGTTWSKQVPALAMLVVCSVTNITQCDKDRRLCTGIHNEVDV